MANVKAPATQASKIKGFRYTRDFVMLVFANNQNAVLGPKDAPTIAVALSLKGSDVEYKVVDTVTTEFGEYDKVVILCLS